MTHRPALFDLHVHSTRSDGVRSPLELARLARLSGLSGIAITDHDILPDATLWKQIEALAAVQLIIGTELSTHWNGRLFHVLGYGFDSSYPELNRLCQLILERRRKRWDAIVSALQSRGLRLDSASLARHRQGASPGRKHLARELVHARAAPSTRVAFSKYLDPFAAEMEAVSIPIEDALSAIHQAKGKAVLAHPPTGMTGDEWGHLATIGLDGIETRFGRVNGRHRRFLEEMAQRHGWISTAGSDYHGDSSGARLGSHHVDRACLARLLSHQE